MTESAILIDYLSSEEIGTFKAMRFAHCGELENIFKENPYGKQIMTYGMIETLHCLVKELVPLSNCAPHVLQFMCFLPCLKDVLRPCPTPDLIQLLWSHHSSATLLWSLTTYSGHTPADTFPLSTSLGLCSIRSLPHLAVYPALT